jgi:hypothetical protein
VNYLLNHAPEQNPVEDIWLVGQKISDKTLVSL